MDIKFNQNVVPLALYNTGAELDLTAGRAGM